MRLWQTEKRWSPIRIVAISASAAFVWAALAQSDGDAHTRAGLRALRSKQFQAALQEFRAGLREAQEQGDTAREGRFHFYVGLAFQDEIEAGGAELDPARRQRLLKGAKDAYESATKLLPSSAAAMNNLADTCAQTGDTVGATRAYIAAIERSEKDQAVYLVNYGDFLRRQGDYEHARRLYDSAFELDPTDDRAFEGLRLCATQSGMDLPALVRLLIEHGRVGRALDTALERLARISRPGPESTELLTSVARCLAMQSYSVAEFAKSETGLRLRGLLCGLLREQEALRDPISEILLAHQPHKFGEPKRRPESFAWWSQEAPQPNRRQRTPPGGWPQDAFTALLRSCGQWYERAKDRKTAEQYYRLAYDLTKHHLDPIALTRLVDLWIRQGERDRLEQFLEEQEHNIFESKNAAIRAMHLPRMYEFHRTLGLIYGHLNRWDRDARGNKESAGTAIFQLRHAFEAARRYNEKVKDPDDMIVEPRVINLLAQGYEVTNQARRAFELRVDEASYLRGIGRLQSATEIYRPIRNVKPPKRLSPKALEQHEELRAEFTNNGFLTSKGAPRSVDAAGRGRPTPATSGENAARMPRVLWSQVPDLKAAGLDRNALQELTRDIQKLYLQRHVSPARRLHLLKEDIDARILNVKFNGTIGTVRVQGKLGPVKLKFHIDDQKHGVRKKVRYVRP